MNMAMQMMKSHQKDMPVQGMDMAMMQDCIEACSACEQACTMCSSTMTGEDMSMCMNMCMNTADICGTMMRMMMRPAGMHRESMMAMLQATTTMCMACADECMNHKDMHADCAMCAEACRQCAMACQKMMDAMNGAMPMA
jgi:hypothetical protein